MTEKKKTPGKTTKKKVDKEKISEVAETKKNNTEIKRIGIVLGFIVLLFGILVAATINSSRKSAKIVDDVKGLLNSAEEKVIYIVRDGCAYCTINEVNMESIKDRYNVDYYEVDIADLHSSDLNEILDALSLDKENFGTPTLVITKDGEVKEKISGVKPFDELFKTLQTNNVIEKSEKLLINYIDYNSFKSIIKKDKNQIIVLASSTCQYCLAERPILDEIVEETGVKVNWLNLDIAFDSEDEYNDFLKSLDWFEENEDWGTPTTLIVNKGKVESVLSGYREKEEIIKFYQNNDLVK